MLTSIKLPPIPSPLLYIALSPPVSTPTKSPPSASPSQPLHWSLLIAPTHESPPPYATDILYTYISTDTHPSTTTPVRKHAPKISARLLIAEVASVERLNAVVRVIGAEGEWEEEDNVEATSLEWVKTVLRKLDEEEKTSDDDDDDDDDDVGGDVGGDGGDSLRERGSGREGKGRDGRRGREKCLGRRMASFESVEAEGRQFARELLEKGGAAEREEGQEVPTRVLFEWRRPPVVGAGGESGSGGEEGGGGGGKSGGAGEVGKEGEGERKRNWKGRWAVIRGSCGEEG